MTKQPPVTLRVPADMRADIEAFAAKKGIAKNAAYVEVLRRGLKAALVDGKPVVAAAAHATLEPVAVKARSGPVAEQASRVSVAAPLMARKAFNPQPKKGTKK